MQTYDPINKPRKAVSGELSAESGAVANAPQPVLSCELSSLCDLARIVARQRPDSEYARGVLDVLRAAAGEFAVLGVAEELTEILNSQPG